MNQGPRYSMVIQWSAADQTYVVTFPEWETAGHIAHAAGATYAEAVEEGQDLLAFLVESQREEGEPPPGPRVYAAGV